MTDLYMIIKSLKKQGKKAYLIRGQLLVTFAAMIISIGVFVDINNKINDVRKLIDFKCIVIRSTEMIKDPDNVNAEKFYQSIKNNSMVKNIGIYHNNTPNTGDNVEKDIWVDKDFWKIAHIKVSRGRTFNSDDFSKKYYEECPIIVGSETAKEHPLNSVIVRPYFNSILKKGTESRNYRVVGVLNDNSKFWNSDSFFVDNINKSIITPDDIKPTASTITSEAIVELKDPNNFDSIKNICVEKLCNGKNIIEVKNYNMLLKDKLNEKKLELFYLGTFSLILIILSSFGLIGVTLTAIISRKKEFGVRYALGALPKDLCKIVYGEILIMFLEAYAVGLIASLILSRFMPKSLGINFSFETVFISFIMIVLLSIVVAIIPIKNIIAAKPVELIRGTSK